jgi:hypothetical protein
MLPIMKKKMDGSAVEGMSKADAAVAAAHKFIEAVKSGDANKLIEAFKEIDVLTSPEGEEGHGEWGNESY